MPNSELPTIQQRIISAATDLFSKLGHSGVSTRDIARLAAVNETSLYRFYPNKRDLFVAALDAEFSKVQLRSDLMSKLPPARDAHAAMLAISQVTMEAVLQQRALIRLVLFSVLEFGEDLEGLYRQHVDRILHDASGYLAPWPVLSQTKADPRNTVLAFIATLLALQAFYPVLTGEGQLSTESLKIAAGTCADLWHAALSAKSEKLGSVSALAHA